MSAKRPAAFCREPWVEVSGSNQSLECPRCLKGHNHPGDGAHGCSRPQWGEHVLCTLPNLRAPSWGRADLESAGQREAGKQEDLIHHCW